MTEYNDDFKPKSFDIGERVRLANTETHGTVVDVSDEYADETFYVVDWDNSAIGDRGWNHSLQKVGSKTDWQNVKLDVHAVTPLRQSLLEKTIDTVVNQRNNTYGPPAQDFSRIAGLLSQLGFEFKGGPVEAHHTAMIMICLKLSRLTWSPEHEDNWLDTAGYAATGWEAFNEGESS